MTRLRDTPSWIPKKPPEAHPTKSSTYLSEGPIANNSVGYNSNHLYPFYNSTQRKWLWYDQNSIKKSIRDDGHTGRTFYSVLFHFTGHSYELNFSRLQEYYADDYVKAEAAARKKAAEVEANRAARQALIPDADSEAEDD